MNEDLEYLFKKDSATFMLEGRKESGKTDFGLRLGQEALEAGLIQRMATNIRTEHPDIDQIANLPDLKTWLSGPGRKYFMLDEAGKIIRRMDFMTRMNKLILDIIQLIRHYDCTFTAIAPNAKFIDSNYMNTDLLDCRIKKIGKHFAEVTNILTHDYYTLYDIERTTIKFWSKDIATFTLEKPMNVAKFSVVEQCAYRYGQGQSMDTIASSLNPPKHRQDVARKIRKYLSLHFQQLKTRNKLQPVGEV